MHVSKVAVASITGGAASRSAVWLLAAWGLLLVAAASASAGDAHQRAGDPQRVAWYARPAAAEPASYGWVGGGSFWPADLPYTHEGTWGRDYGGVLPIKRVWLDWSHGRRYQGGGGTYKTDGPKLKHLGH